SEALHMVNAIRTAQEAYKAETGIYADISPGLAFANASGAANNLSNAYPNSSPGNFKTGWGAACAGSQCNATMSWLSLPVHTDGAVMYASSTMAGPAGASLSSYNGNSPPTLTFQGRSGSYTVTLPSAPTTDWYVVSAVGDPDGNGKYSSYTGSSFVN